MKVIWQKQIIEHVTLTPPNVMDRFCQRFEDLALLLSGLVTKPHRWLLS
jgi:hypothetical protein